MSLRTVSRSLAAAACFALAAAVPPAAAQTADSGTTPAVDTSVDSADSVEVTKTVVLSVAGDTWVSSIGQTSSQSASPELVVGSKNFGLTKSRSYLEFDYAGLAGIPADAMITSAQLTLSNFLTGSCSGTAIRASRVTGAWTVGGLKWSAQPAVTALGAGTSTAAYGAAACPAEGTATFDVKGIVRDWVAGAAKHGIQIKAEKEGAATGYRKYRSAENGDAAKVPTLTVTYNSYPNTPTDLTVAPGNPNYATSLTPTFSAVVSDPDGPAGALFELRKGTTALSPVVWTGSTELVDSGEEASATLPADVLVDGAIYRLTASGYDGDLKSKSAVVTYFKVDVTAPEVTISSDVFTDDVWTTPMPTSAKFTFDGSADTGGFYVTTDGVEFTVGANATGDYSVSIKPTPGWHSTVVTPVDRAGNLGQATTFRWGTGSPEFTSPAFWQQSTGSFEVDISAPAGADGARLQWHLPGEAVWHTADHVTSAGDPWGGSVAADGGRSTTGLLTWTATEEPLGTGTLQAPTFVVIRGCFEYPAEADLCTAARYVELVEE